MEDLGRVTSIDLCFYSWNKNLTYHRGNAMGGEFRAKGVNVLLGPVVGPMFRVARGGRNWEGFSPDPYLSGSLVALTVAGVQDRGVMTSTKVCGFLLLPHPGAMLIIV